ncbi:glycoside hydrolase family 2 TIM barrel-domain containing protein [Candidatus Halobonum tyrrellensis]|uniref:beta-galactosidase n=1 Tax=Candidatus Halobonum tyrrellensis G22 TaxID=1324957 RepID=V4HAJ2_9EURY|nr:glycoside hydrolase family 2 TIM barrel-domain containing protein [Candidatus Halobonum tyrrellensis]ESP87073.1 beta-galactosidase [Candidatus Halobonum tyrrellensis G22]
MSKEHETPSRRAVAPTRRTVLSGVAGITLGSTLPVGASAAEEAARAAAEGEYADIVESVGTTPRPAETDAGGTRSLNGTWEFALSGSDGPPSSADGSRVVTPDSSPAGNDATLANDPPVVTDESARAVDLAGDAYVAVGDAGGLDFTEPGFTVQLTFKYSADTLLFSKGGSQYSAGVYGGELSFWTQGEGDWPTVTGGDLTPGQWYTATFVMGPDAMRLYVDGEAVGSLEHGVSSLPHTDSPLHVGYNSADGTQGTPVVDAFAAFDAALSAEQVAGGFDSVPDSAVAWLGFDSASGGVVADESGSGNDGELVGDPAFVAGEGGQALDLAGAPYVSAGSPESLDLASTGFTLEATVKYDGGSGLVVDKGSSPVSTGTEQFGLGIYDGTASFYMQTADGSYPDSVQTDVSTGEWHRLTVVVAADENRIYVDGEFRGAISHGASGLASSDAPFVVGGDDLDVSVRSTAALDTALTDAQVAEGFSSVPSNAVLWLTYDSLEDRSVEWREEAVPGQWAYEDYYVPSGSSEWYPPEGQRGWYRREFEVPDGWEGRVKLHFGAVYSHAWVYVDGTLVTEHVGGYTPFEVDITDAVDPDGSTDLAVGVAQRSASDDMGWQNVTGGITRDVTLVGLPDAHLSDLVVRTDLDAGSATVHVDAPVTNAGDAALDAATATVTLTGPDGSTAGSAEAEVTSLAAGATEELSVEIPVSDPRTWDPEHPRLYDVAVELNAGETTERVTESVGIRDVEVSGNQLLINGTSVTLRGVNWEEIHLPQYGQAIPPAITREDARRLKEANVNYVRTAHHPTSEAFLEACDELGIVVEMEAPHMFVGRDRGDPYPDVVVQQTLETVERDRNRASVCIWSIANESEWYDVFDTVAGLVDEFDPTRPKIFNHDVYDPSDPWHDEYELRAHHYPALRSGSTVEEYSGTDAPLLYDEYAHTYCYNDEELVTDPGLRDEWGRVFETIWERCRNAESVAGAALWAGGDHLEQWGEYLWGMLDRNRRHRPEFWHVRKVYAPVTFSDAAWAADGGSVTLTVENRYEFTDLSEVTLTADSDGDETDLDVSLAPGEETRVTVPAPGESVRVEAVHDGWTVNEFVAEPDDADAAAADDGGAEGTGVETGDGSFTVDAGSVAAHVDSETGAVEVRSADGDSLVDGLEFAVTPTQDEAGREYETAIDHRLSGRTVTGVRRDGDRVLVDVAYDTAEGTFTLEPAAEGLRVGYAFTLTEAVDAREAGVAFPARPGFTTLSWDRDGLWSAYPADHVGRETGTASAFPDGTRPESPAIDIQTGQPWKDDTTAYGSNDFRSTKRNVHRVDLTDGAGTGLRAASDADREQHVRAQARTESVDLLVLDRSISGTNPYGWMNRQPALGQEPTLEAGQTVESAVTLRAAEATDAESYYQVDFAAGEPIEELGEDGLYAAQDRLMRFAFGSAEEGITEKDTAWPSAEIRDCLDYGHIREHDDGTASVTFTVADGCDEMTLSLAVYSMSDETFDADTADEQVLLESTTGTFGPGEHTVTVDLPSE